MRVMTWVYQVGTRDGPRPRMRAGAGTCGGSARRALGLVGALGLEVRDGGLDLGLVLGLAGLLDHLGGDPGRHELLEHSHVRLLVVGWFSIARTNEWPHTLPPLRAAQFTGTPGRRPQGQDSSRFTTPKSIRPSAFPVTCCPAGMFWSHTFQFESTSWLREPSRS